MKFSIIIPVFHGKEFLKKSLGSLLRIDFDPNQLEVIVVFPQDDIDSKQIVSEFIPSAPFHVIPVLSRGYNRAEMLNSAVEYSKGYYITFIDDDCLVPPDWLNTIETFMNSNQGCGMVGGRDVLVNNRSSFDESLDIVFSSFWGNAGIRDKRFGFFGKYFPRLWNMCIARPALFSISNKKPENHVFDENLNVFEDVDIGRRVESEGYKICYNPMLYVHHYRNTNFKDFLFRNFHMGLICRNLGVHILLHRLLVFGMILILVMACGSLLFEPLRFFLLFPIAFCVMAFIGIIIINLRKINQIWSVAWIPLILSGLYLSRGMGYFTGDLKILKGKTVRFFLTFHGKK